MPQHDAEHTCKPDAGPDRRRTVLQIVPSLDAGGAERSTIDIARALTKAGWTALVASEGGRMEAEVKAAGAELLRMPVSSKSPLTILANAARLAQLIRERNISLVHARSRAPAWSGFIAARATLVPFVTTYHGIYESKSSLKRLYNAIMARGDAVIANSAWTAAHIRKTYPKASGRVVTIARGIDFETFDPASVSLERVKEQRSRWGIAEDQRVIFLPGRITRWKGQLVLVEALDLLKRGGRLLPDVRAVMAGDAQGRDAYVQEIRNSIVRNGLGNMAILSDHIDDMASAYLASDIVVSASTDPEAFGRVPPEAAAMGRPVIATDHGGARETVLPGQSGLLVPPGDAAALAEGLADLLGRPREELSAMGAKGRAHVLSHFSVERMCADTLAVYDTLIGRRSAKSSSAS